MDKRKTKRGPPKVRPAPVPPPPKVPRPAPTPPGSPATSAKRAARRCSAGAACRVAADVVCNPWQHKCPIEGCQLYTGPFCGVRDGDTGKVFCAEHAPGAEALEVAAAPPPPPPPGDHAPAAPGPGARWPDQHTWLLLETILSDKDAKKVLTGPGDEGKRSTGNNRVKTQCDILADIMKKAPDHGFNRNGQAVYDKWTALKSKYNNLTKHNGKTGRNGKTWAFYSEMEKLLGNREASRPTVIAGGGKGAANAAMPSPAAGRRPTSTGTAGGATAAFDAFDDDAKGQGIPSPTSPALRFGGDDDDESFHVLPRAGRARGAAAEDDSSSSDDEPPKRGAAAQKPAAKSKPPLTGKAAQAAFMEQAAAQHDDMLDVVDNMSSSLSTIAKGFSGGDEDREDRVSALEDTVDKLVDKLQKQDGKLDMILAALQPPKKKTKK